MTIAEKKQQKKSLPSLNVIPKPMENYVTPVKTERGKLVPVKKARKRR